MLIEENTAEQSLALTSYHNGQIETGGRIYTQPLVWRNGRVEAMAAARPEDLTADMLLAQPENLPLPEVVIIGTGAKQQFLHPKIAAALSAHGIGLECMNTASACRTLVLLQGEGRSAWAWLWP